jgi:hypothetical protein
MSINSVNQNLDWPTGATNLLVSGKSTTGTYTYPSTLTAGIYAIKATSLNKDTTGATVYATANAQTKSLINDGVAYLNLSSSETSLVVRPNGAIPTTFTRIFSTLPSIMATGYQIAYNNGMFTVTGTATSGTLVAAPAIM